MDGATEALNGRAKYYIHTSCLIHEFGLFGLNGRQLKFFAPPPNLQKSHTPPLPNARPPGRAAALAWPFAGTIVAFPLRASTADSVGTSAHCRIEFSPPPVERTYMSSNVQQTLVTCDECPRCLRSARHGTARRGARREPGAGVRAYARSAWHGVAWAWRAAYARAAPHSLYFARRLIHG